MMLVELTQGLFALCDAADYDELSLWNWKAASTGQSRFYARRYCPNTGGNVSMQQHLLGKREGLIIDHVNNFSLDNRRINLRWATHSQNVLNVKSKRKAKTGFRGVHLSGKTGPNCSYAAFIHKDGERLRLGYFGNRYEAALAYNEAALKHHGLEWAQLNDVPDDWKDLLAEGAKT